MATTQNAGDLLLAATSPRMETIPFGGTIDFANVTGTTKPANNATKNVISSGLLSNRPTGSDGDIYWATDTTPLIEYKKIAGVWIQTSTSNTGIFSTLIGQLTSTNYASYLANGSISDRAFSQNVGAASATQQASITISPDTRDVILTVGGLVIGATAGGGNTYGILRIEENGSFIVDTRVLCNFPNSDLVRPAQICVSHSLFRTSSVPSGNITYRVTLSASPNPVGSTGETVRWTYIQALVIKR